MTDFQKDLITVVKSALTGKKFELSQKFDLEEAAKVAKKHGIIPILYYGAYNCGIESNSPLMQQLFMQTCMNIQFSKKQMFEIGQLCKAFDQAEIDYMLLKGAVLKSLYPKQEMRCMGDADILVKPKQYKKITTIMKNLNYTAMTESDHEYIWDKANIHIELHKRLIPSYIKDYYAYYGDGWHLATVKNGTQYSMSDEDTMIYSFTHFAKHYRDAGIGIRHLLDLWIFKKNKPNLNEQYIKKELTSLKLYEFYLNVLNTLDVWFEDRAADEKTDFITEVIFNSGLYGTKTAYILSGGVKSSKTTENIKRKKFFSLIFLPYNNMCQKYRFLKHIPILLPIMWCVRIFNVLLFKTKKIKHYNNGLKVLNTENIKDYQSALNFVGLDFNFKE